MKKVLFAAPPLLLILSACGSQSYSSQKNFCDGFVGGTLATSIDTQCAGCSIAAPMYAIDGSLGTASVATIATDAGGGVSYTAKAPAGTKYLSGTTPGVYLGLPSGAIDNLTVTITISDSTAATPVSQSVTPVMAQSFTGDGSTVFYGFNINNPAPIAFDTVEFQLQETETSGSQNYQVFEMCNNGGPLF